jgi:NADH-quinone oxidoreductase subunit M
MFADHLISWVVFLPLVAGAVVLFLPKGNARLIRGTSLAMSLVIFAVSLGLWARFRAVPGMQLVETADWIPRFGISYTVGLDGISLLLVLLVTFLQPIVILGSFRGIQERQKAYYFSLFFLQTGMLGAFVALDLFLFYIFWEMMLIPMYLLIGVWGGPRRIYATLKFFIYTMIGSLLMLVAILYVYFKLHAQTGEYTFDLFRLYQVVLTPREQGFLFAAFALSFAIKVPMFPFHTWLPDAHVEAPTAGSVILAGVLLKMGTYGFLRFAMPLFPGAAEAAIPVILILSVIGIIYGALVAMIQDDVKKLVAYSSVSHLGFVMLGIFALNTQSVTGGIYQMLNHGLSTGALFLLVGMIYDRRHTRMIEDFGGISKVMPVYAAVFMIVTLSSIGLPGTNGFVGEFLILLGAFRHSVTFAVLAALGVVLGAAYMLWMVQRVFFGPVKHEENRKLQDLDLREILTMAPIVVFIFIMGIAPQPMLKRIEPSVNHFISVVTEGGEARMAGAPAGHGDAPAAREPGSARAASTPAEATPAFSIPAEGASAEGTSPEETPVDVTRVEGETAEEDAGSDRGPERKEGDG